MGTPRYFRSSPMLRRIVSSAAAVTISLVLCPIAHATPEDEARLLFREGRQLAAQGYYEAACSSFEKSLRLEPGAGTEFHLAECWERTGRTASAHQLFAKVALASQSAGQDSRAQLAFERADRLLTRLSRLRVQCESTCPEDVLVLREGVTLPQESWLESNVVDPGVFKVEVTFANGTRWSTQVLVPNDPGVVVVTIPTPSADPEQFGPKNTLGAAKEELKDPPNKSRQVPAAKLAITDEKPHEQASSPWPKTLLITGVTSFALSGAAALWLNHRNGQASAICPSNEGCSETEIDRHTSLVTEAKRSRTAVYAGIGLGTVAVSTAGIWHFFFRPTKAGPPSPQVSLRLQSQIRDDSPAWNLSAEGKW